jgi:Spy/CpxP family protein refolding chaperone
MLHLSGGVRIQQKPNPYVNNKIRLVAVFSLLSIAVASPVVRAADAPAAPPRHERGPGGPGGAKERRQAMTEHLGLTAEQQGKIGAIMKEQAEQGRAFRDDKTLTQEQRREKLQATRKVTGEKIRAVLNPGQQAKFDAKPPRGADGPGGAHQPKGER